MLPSEDPDAVIAAIREFLRPGREVPFLAVSHDLPDDFRQRYHQMGRPSVIRAVRPRDRTAYNDYLTSSVADQAGRRHLCQRACQNASA